MDAADDGNDDEDDEDEDEVELRRMKMKMKMKMRMMNLYQQPEISSPGGSGGTRGDRTWACLAKARATSASTASFRD